MVDVYFYEAFEEEHQELIKYLPAQIRAGFTWKTVQESGDEHPPALLISIRTQSQIPSEWCSQLEGILSRSTGYDHLQIYRKMSNNQIQLGYLPLYCNRAVAEQAMLLWMALLRKLPRQMEQFPDFNRDGLTGIECQGKTLLVVGVGNIGSEIVKIGEGLGMTVWGVDLVEKHSFVHYTTLEKALPRADIIVCAMNLTEENVSYFDYHRLKQARQGVIFINIARGEMSPSRDLLRLVQENHLGGLGLDIYNRESELAITLRQKKESNDPEVQATLELMKYPQVIFTPHNAFNTIEAVQRKAQQSVQQIQHFLEEREFIWPVP
ncbi:MAG: hypothetical protein Kow0042_26030 [Calditrichia bacterium]